MAIQINVLHSSREIREEFGKCCHEFSRLDFAVAWCGRPSDMAPFSLVKEFKGEVHGTVGVDLAQSHPNGIQFLMDRCDSFRIFQKKGSLFHPKYYRFTSATEVAVIIGSSNFTVGGFQSNQEVDVLIRGNFQEVTSALKGSTEYDYFVELRRSPYTFEPNEKWLKDYEKSYKAQQERATTAKIPTAPAEDDLVVDAGWLGTADWRTYRRRLDGALLSQRIRDGYFGVLSKAKTELSAPWAAGIFSEKESRRLIGGIGEHGWFGHVSASGAFRGLLASGSAAQHLQIVSAINSAATIGPLIDYRRLEGILDRLVAIGPSMKVWGRLLTITRPDLFCTVAAPHVRDRLSSVTGISKAHFETPAGYIELLKYIHGSPWFTSPEPLDFAEKQLWKNRVALMDAIFYHEKS